jgi:hypothetical protein
VYQSNILRVECGTAGRRYMSTATSSPARPRCGNSSTEREFPSDKVYRRDDRGIVAAQWVSRRLNITDQNFKPAAAKKLTEVPIGASIVRPTETTPYSVHRAKSANRQGFPRRQNPQPR